MKRTSFKFITATLFALIVLGQHYASVLTAPNFPAIAARLTTPGPTGLNWLPFAPPAEQVHWSVTDLDSESFRAFVASLTDGRKDVVRGVYVDGVLALPIVEQPAGETAYVSEDPGVITLFGSAASYDITGLLAHNYLAGALFYQLQVGQEVRVVYGDGAYRRYQVTEVQQYQKLQPNNLRSELVHLADGRQYATAEVFDRFYAGDHHVTFQTCLEQNGLSNWGLTFIVAAPITGAP